MTTHIRIALLALSIGATARAQKDTVYQQPPVLVTATTAVKGEHPVTLSNIGRGDLRSLVSTQDIPVVLSTLPSVTTYSENGSGIGYNYINLRGFDQRRISIMINGIPQNDPEDHNVYWVDFPDLLANAHEIQVQRGAGSAFYGPPAIGGSVNVIANPFRPGPSVTFELMAGFQEFGAKGSSDLITRKQSVAINSGWVADRYLMYGRLSTLKTDGYRELGWVDLSSYVLGVMRVDGSMTTRFHAFGGPIADGLAYVGLPKEYNNELHLRRSNLSYWEYGPDGTTVGYAVPQKRGAKENFSQPHVELLHDWKVSDRLSLHTTAFIVNGDGFFDYDGDWIAYTPAAVDWFQRHVGYGPAFGSTQFPSMIFRGAVENRQWGLLPRAEIGHEGGTLTVGVEARVHRSHHYGSIVYASEAPDPYFDPTTKVYAYDGVRDIFSLFAHEVYEVTPVVSVVGDLQLVHNRYGVRNERFLGNAFDVFYTFLNPRAGVNISLTDEMHAYGFVGLTSREPRLRNLYAAEDAYFGAMPEFKADTSGGIVRYDFTAPHARPEQLLNVEAGWGWRAPAAQVALTGYWMEFTDELVKSGGVDIFGQPVTGNADRTRHIGVELEGSVAPTASLTIGGNATISQNKIISFTSYESGAPAVLDGNELAGFPAFLANGFLTYEDGGTRVDVRVQYVGGFYTDNLMNPRNQNDAYTTAQVTGLQSIGVTDGIELILRFEVRNIFNSLYTTGGEGAAFFPAAERNYLVGIILNM